MPVFVIALSLILGASANGAGQSSDSFIIPNDVISTGGGERNSTTFIVNDTVGQSSPVGISTGTDLVVHGGFWGPMEPAVVPTPTYVPTEEPTPTITATPTMAPVPAVTPLGGIGLLILVGGLLAASTRTGKRN